MMVIRKEQYEVLSQYTLGQFFQAMENYLREAYPEQTAGMSHEQLRELIAEGTERAGHYDITDENDVKRFLEYLVLYGRDFGKSAATSWAEQFLTDTNLPATARMNEIDSYELFVISLAK